MGTDGHQHERRHHFRGKVRPGRVLQVRFRAAPHTAWVPAATRDIGVGGAFIVTPLIQPVGTAVTVELQLTTSDQRFTLPAVVRWASSSAGSDGGMGVQFVGVDVDVLLELNDYFAALGD